MVEVPDYSFISKDAGPSLSGSINNWLTIDKNVYDLKEKGAQQAAGQAYQGAINPLTGEFDPNEFRRRLAASGPAAMAAGHELANTQQISSDQLKQNLAKAQWINSTSGALLQSGDFSDAAMLGALHNGVAGGILTLPEAQRQLATMPPDAAGRQRWLQEHQDTSASFQEQMDQRYGKPVTIDQGTGVQGGVQNQRGGGAIGTSGSAVPVYAAPGTQGQPVHWTTSDGITHDGTWAQYNVDRGNGRVVGQVSFGGGPAAGGPGGAGSGTSGAPGTQVQPGVANAANPPRLNPAQPPAPGQPAAPPAPKLTDTTQPEPGMAAKWDASAKQYNADNEAASSYQQRIFPLVQAASILKSGDVVTGQGAEAFNRVKSFLMTQATNLGVDAQTIQQADFDKVGKYLQQYVNMQGMSGRSDQALASAVSGNPSSHISTLANQQILPAMLGMERMRQAIITDFKAQGGSPRNYSDYASDWQNKHDPRAFIFDQLDNDQRQKITASLKTPAQRKAFSDTLDIVERNPGIMGQAVMPGR